MKIKIKKVREDSKIPSYGTEYSAGADLYACINEDISIMPNETVKVPTGIAMEIPVGYGGFIYARSSSATKKGLAPANKVGIIDADYRGEIFIPIYNHSNEIRVIEKAERIAQIVIAPFIKAEFNEVDELNDTKRGKLGFGSTGNK